jgi:hypothetical protein
MRFQGDLSREGIELAKKQLLVYCENYTSTLLTLYTPEARARRIELLTAKYCCSHLIIALNCVEHMITIVYIAIALGSSLLHSAIAILCSPVLLS